MTTTSAYPDALAAEIVAALDLDRGERLVRVDDPEHARGVVLVRWKLGRREPWRCPVHGPQSAAECPHTFAAGLLLAENLLGLTRMPELRPDERNHR